jgi:hypothetical protein
VEVGEPAGVAEVVVGEEAEEEEEEEAERFRST